MDVTNGIALIFLIDLGYKGALYKHTNMFADHMHQPWRTLAAIINKCLSGKTAKKKRDQDETVDVSEESEPEPAKKKTFSKRRVKKKVTLSTDNNIIFYDPDVALELAKSISKTEVEEARQVYATHAMTVTKFVPEFAKKNSGGRSSKSVVIQEIPCAPKSNLATSKSKLKGAPSLTLEEQKATYIMQDLKESKKTSKRQQEEKVILQWGYEQDNEFFDDDNDDVEKEDKDGDADDEGDDHISDTQDADDEDAKTEFDKDDIYKYKIRVHKDEDEEMINAEVDDVIKGDEEINDAAKENAKKILEIKDDPKKAELPPSSSSLSKSSDFGYQVLKLSLILLWFVLVEKLEKDVVELKTIDHSIKALAILKSQVPTVVDSYLESKVGDTPTVDLEQRSEKCASEILQIKRDQAKKQQMPKFTIKSTDKAALKEYDLKSSLYQSMHANKSFNRNSANHQLYHALMEVLIEDENAMDKGGKKTKRKRTKESESSKKPSSTKETSKGKAPSKGSKTGKSILAKELVEEPIAEVVMDDAGDDVAHDDNQPQDTSEPKTRKTPNQDCIELEYNFQECFNALTDKLDWNNPERDRYPFDLSKPLPLQGPLEVTYTSSITKTKAAQCKIKGIEDMIPTLWSTIKHAKAILGVKSVSVKKLHGYGHLEEIVVKRSDQRLYKFKEGDVVDLYLNNIKDMLLLAV
nr:hypothetical protein [Tanacetum cinerariifolium]